STGVTGDFTGDVSLSIPGVSFSSQLKAVFDTGAGKVQVTGLNTKLTIAGQQLTANFTIDSSPGLVKIGLTSVAGTSLLKLGSFVDIKAATGALLVRAGGVAGQITVTDFAFTLPNSISLTGGSISIAVNTTPSAVKEVVVVGGTPIVLDLPA